MDIIYIFFVLLLIGTINAVIFWLLLNREIKFHEAIKLTFAAGALNRLLLSGSGYAAMSWKLKRDNLPIHKCLLSFLFLELFSILPWLILGFYFGAKLAIRIPIFAIVILIIILIFAIYKRKRMLNFFGFFSDYFNEIRQNIVYVICLALLNVVLGVSYYSFLFKFFNFSLPLLDILRIASISFALGYLSPSPAGLGFKEGSLTFLLMQRALSFKDSLSAAVTDRMVVTVFYLILGFIFGADIIMNEIRKKVFSYKKSLQARESYKTKLKNLNK